MKFQSDKKRLTRLSDDISDDNKYKQTLIDMETPDFKTPVYSFLVIGLMVYVWAFLSVMIYYKSEHLGISIFVVVFSTISSLFVYKKKFPFDEHPVKAFTVFIFYVVFFLTSIYVGISDAGTCSPKQLMSSFFFFRE